MAKIAAPTISAEAQRIDSVALYVGAAFASWLAGLKDSTASNLEKAVKKQPLSPRLRVFYARSLKWQGRPWMQLESLEQGALQFAHSPFYSMSLGQARLEMNQFDEARAAFEQVLKRRQTNAKAWWYLGRSWDAQGRSLESAHAYAQTQAFSWKLSVRRFGVGILFEQIGQWRQAAAAYENCSQMRHGQAMLHLRCAHVYEQLHDWPRAANSYRRALESKPNWMRALRALAWVLARNQQWESSVFVCKQILEKNSLLAPNGFNIRWLLIFCLAQDKKYKEACELFSKPSIRSKIYSWSLQPRLIPCGKDVHFHAAQSHELLAQARLAIRKKNWQLASDKLALLLDRWPDHVGRFFELQAQALANLDRNQEACEAFIASSFYRWPHNSDEQRYAGKKAQRQVMEYTEYLETLDVRSKVVLYESYAGISVSCNPYAIYQGTIDDSNFADWTHVWVLNDLSRIPSDCAKRSNVIFVAKESQLYLRFLATAGWLINNSTFPSYFIRRKEQRYLNTWHGTPLKTLGKDIRGNFMEHKNTARNLLHATHVLSPNPHTSWVLIDRYDIEAIYQGQLAQTGYPRNDLLINATEVQKAGFKEKLGLKTTAKPLVLYAPTWRGILGHPELDSKKLIFDLQVLQQKDCQIIFRGHYFSEKALAEAGLDHVLVAPQSIDTSELLAITDVLITDYSSIFFDYLSTGKPILFYTYDLEQYCQERGLYFGMDEMPGPNCQTLEQLGAELELTLQSQSTGVWQPDARYREAQCKFAPCDDGQATRRAVEFFFKNKSEIAIQPKQDKRKTLLFFAGAFAPMGITTAALNLIRALDPGQYTIVVAIDPDAVKSQPERIERLSRLPLHVHIIGRVGRQVCSAQERLTIDSFHRNDELTLDQWPVYEQAFKREFRRMFGDWEPDHVINYDGYARFWAGLFAYGPEAQTQRLIYLHNDMHSEWKMKFPHMAGMFALYPRYNLLISVAKAIAEKNRVSLSSAFGIAPHKFVYADNMPDFEGVQRDSLELLDADLNEWLGETSASMSFACIGRFSPEKNHSLLLEAFSMLVKVQPKAKLVIIGDGPLRASLEAQVKELGLEQSVLLAGLRSNPFPLLMRCGCFVLPSRHEGQPMVLLEALALGKSIIATDIPGVRELLAEGLGRLVGLKSSELIQAMIEEIEGRHILQKMINMESYKNNVKQQFRDLLFVY
ncbi:glycosyltransferase [Comamonas testosteroni]|uniref:Glycosyltransferase n=1 Tax=Comamonas testosteroni TaxID=285 RepID=A0A373F696_COMTE|nr:glycosyltransferase [Comamonas testosteroni]